LAAESFQAYQNGSLEPTFYPLAYQLHWARNFVFGPR
jgi:hypothetical protein